MMRIVGKMNKELKYLYQLQGESCYCWKNRKLKKTQSKHYNRMIHIMMFRKLQTLQS